MLTDRARRRFFPLVAGALALGLTLLLAIPAHDRYMTERQDRLSDTVERIERRVWRNVLALRAMQGLYDASDGEIGRAQLQRFLDGLPLAAELRGAQGFGFALATPTAAPETASARIRASYGLERTPWPQTSEPVRYPIVLLEPQDQRNAAAFGYDMYADPVRRAAMQRAAVTRHPAATPPVRLVQELQDGRQFGVLVYVPVFARNAGAADAPIGFVYVPFRVGDLVEAVLADSRNPKIRVQIFSGAPGPETLVYANADTLVDPVPAKARVADAEWTILVGEAGDRGRWASPAFFILALGAAFAAALTAFGYQQARRLDATERLVAEIARNAEQKEILLLEMRHRIKNSIARILALFRLSAREAGDRDSSFARQFEQRLQAMASAQALLVSGAGGAMSLQELIAQAAPDLPKENRTVEGPDLRIDEEQAQALGLIIHEWATNSLKYGALASGGKLAVNWRVENTPDGRVVRFDWTETGLKNKPDFSRSGFGSRLTKVMVEGTLNGQVRREATDGALAMRVTFPLARELAMQA